MMKDRTKGSIYLRKKKAFTLIFDLVFSCEKNIFSYKEFCFGLANILDRFVEYWKKLKTLKAENAQKVIFLFSQFLVIHFLSIRFDVH